MVEDGSMRAATLEALETDLQVEDIPVPEPKAEEVLLKVAAYGVCHAEQHMTKTKLFPDAGCPGPRDLGMGRDSTVKKGTRPEEVMRRGFVGEGID